MSFFIVTWRKWGGKNEPRRDSRGRGEGARRAAKPHLRGAGHPARLLQRGGYFCSCYVDEDGYFWITDRKKDLIIKAGENISPRAIEEVLFRHPRVSEAAVIGIKDEVYGEEIKAFVVLKPGQNSTAAEIIEYCRTKLPSFLVPKQVALIKALPKSLVGKVLKKELRKLP